MIVGIDLGTTNSLVAAWKGGEAVVIPNALGDRLTPSCVSIDDDGTVVVGRAARDRGVAKPDSSAAVFKRAMGTDREYRLAGKAFRPEELSALVLRELKRDAEAFLGETVDSAVITVPAYFNDTQRKATRTAGQLAGLRVERLLNEPTAAALAYGLHHRPTESRFLVFDLGGGTFDVSVLEWFEGVMEVRASTGDAFLGGEDFVEALVNAFLAKHASRLKERPPPEFLAQLHESAERAKRRLSEHANATISAPIADRALEMEVDEAQFLALSRPVLDRIVAPVSRAIRDARLTVEQLDEVLLVGGSTRMPLVRKLAARLFGRFPAMHVNPDEAIAMGAAVQAGLIMRDAALDEVVLTDVAPHTLGVAVSKRIGDRSEDGYFSPLIERNTVIPASRVGDYSPTQDFQKTVRFDVYQGEGRMVRDNVHLGTLEVPLPGKPIAESNIQLRFTYDVSGLLEVEAALSAGGGVHRLVIENNKGTLTPAQIEQRLAALESLKVLPRDRADVRAVVARGERLYAERLGEEREAIDSLMRELEQVLAGQDPDGIARACERLSRIFDEIEGKPYL